MKNPCWIPETMRERRRCRRSGMAETPVRVPRFLAASGLLLMESLGILDARMFLLPRCRSRVKRMWRSMSAMSTRGC